MKRKFVLWPGLDLILGLALILCLGFPLASSADIILLTNGKSLEGQVQDLGNGKVRILLSAGSMTVPSSQIETVQVARTLDEIVTDELARLAPNDGEGRFRLAQRARAEQHNTLSRRLLQETIAADPDHETARRLLGYVSHEGSWVTEEQLHVLRGEVQYRGEWVSASLRDQMVLQESQRRLEARESRRQARQRPAPEQRAAATQRSVPQQSSPQQVYVQRDAGCAFGSPGSFGRVFSHSGFGHSGFGHTGFGHSPFGYSAFGSGFQTLEPFQPGRIQVQRQSYNYSFRQIHRSRAPAPRPLPRAGYRRSAPPARR